MSMKKLIVIGDIHGRTCWKELVREDAVNVFVGDYFSPYHRIPFEDQEKNFLEIVQYKKDHPSTILLIGNHDEDHWHICERYSRHDRVNLTKIQKLFEDNKEYFQAAYSFENKVLITHAGVSSWWYNRRVLKKINEANDQMSAELQHSMTPDKVAAGVNKAWLEDPITNFSFRGNCRFSDYYGTSEFQSPMWIRYEGLHPDSDYSFNIFKGLPYIQVYGHTINDQIEHYSDPDNVFKGQCYMIDCLEYRKECLLIEIDDNEVLHVSHYSTTPEPPKDKL